MLSGELCRGERGELSLEAQLLDADGFIVWGERFVEVVNRFDQVTERLATLVATGAGKQLGDVFASAQEPALNKAAYEQNVIGWEYLERGVHDKARAAFEKALSLEPAYAAAKFGLALLEVGPFGSPDEGRGSNGPSRSSKMRWPWRVESLRSMIAMPARTLLPHESWECVQISNGRPCGDRRMVRMTLSSRRASQQSRSTSPRRKNIFVPRLRSIPH